VGTERIEKSADAIMAMLDGLWLDWQRRRNMKALEHGISACLDLVALYMPDNPRSAGVELERCLAVFASGRLLPLIGGGYRPLTDIRKFLAKAADKWHYHHGSMAAPMRRSPRDMYTK
jgi:hypothetical protein